MKRVKRTAILIMVLTIIFSVYPISNLEYSYGSSVDKLCNTSTVADSRVVDAFEDLGFKVVYDSKLEAAGCFSVRRHAIIMRDKNKLNTLHELGHFLSRLMDCADSTTEFKEIFRSEKGKYNGVYSKYIIGNSKEYFAQSFADYTKNPTMLKKDRPKTYRYVRNVINSITKDNVNAMNAAYSWAW